MRRLSAAGEITIVDYAGRYRLNFPDEFSDLLWRFLGVALVRCATAIDDRPLDELDDHQKQFSMKLRLLIAYNSSDNARGGSKTRSCPISRWGTEA